MSTDKFVWQPHGRACGFAQSLGLKNQQKWREYCKSGQKPDDISPNPNVTYKNRGWISWRHWLGTGNVVSSKRKYRPHGQARKFVRLLGLKKTQDWVDYCKSGQKPNDIPATPKKVYRDAGWQGMRDWLGTTFLSFKQARKIARSLGLKNKRAWDEWVKTDARPVNIPSNPSVIYKDCGWQGVKDWLGTKILPFKQARKIARSLGLKNQRAWQEWVKTDARPVNIPSNPSITYKDTGWQGMKDWLGTSIVNDTMKRKHARELLELRTVLKKCVVSIQERARLDDGGMELALLRTLCQKHSKLMKSVEGVLNG